MQLENINQKAGLMRILSLPCIVSVEMLKHLPMGRTFLTIFSALNFITLSTLFFSLQTFNSFSQGVGINTTGNAADPSAILDVNSTAFPFQGTLITRLTTTNRDLISSPAVGLLIFNLTTNCFEAYVNGAWNTVSCPAACTPPAAPTANAASSVGCTSFIANWTASAGASAYLLDVATDAGFTSFVAGYNNLNVGNVTSSSVMSLTIGTTYYYRVRATTACVSGNSGTINASTLTVPTQPSVITGTSPVCQSAASIAYSVTNVGGVTYTWTYSGTGYTQASGGTTNSITADFSAAATSGTLTVTPSNTCGSGTAQTFVITVSGTPTIANAGSAINPACDVTTATLAGNSASVGAGAWSVVSGTATITTPSSPTSGVTGLAVPSTATLRWTISNTPCSASTSDVVITTTSCVQTVSALVVGGGGGANSGGGGAGGYQSNSSLIVTPQAYTITVGSGGTGAVPYSTNHGTNGSNSSFSAITANGGGGGGDIGDSGNGNGLNGGSGGGGGAYGAGTTTGGTGSQGNNGGTGSGPNPYPSGGGGGASAVGGNAASGICGNGGNGTANSISGSSVTYAGGGGGGDLFGTGTAGVGGAGGGGAGSSTGNGATGTANTGGGGGGAKNGYTGGNGGSGIVIISYPTGSISATGGTITTSGGNTIHTFTTNGTFTVQ